MSVITGSVLLAQTTGLVQFNGAGTQYVVSASNGVLYAIILSDNSDIYYKRSFNNGMTWTTASSFSGATTTTQLSVWYDRWSGIDDHMIHMAFVNSADDDVKYRYLNTNTNTLGSLVVAAAHASTAANGALSICRSRGGDLFIAYNIDGGTETGFVTSSDTGSTWLNASNPNESSTDYYVLMPGYNTNANDMHLYFWDVSANELSVKRYNKTTNVWTETSIATSMTDSPQSTMFPNLALFPDLDNSRNILAAWSRVDFSGARLRCWEVGDSSITGLTDIVDNSTDDQGLVALGVDKSTSPDTWYAFYGGNSDGSETFLADINIYYKTSTDDGTTWGDETLLTDTRYPKNIKWLVCTPIFNEQFNVMYHNDAAIDALEITTYVDTGDCQGNGTTGGSITFS